MDPNSFCSVMFSRGCPFNCNFCASWKIWTRKARFHTPQYIVNAIEHVHKNIGTKFIRFDDDTFTFKKKPVLEICRLLKEKIFPLNDIVILALSLSVMDFSEK